MTLYVRPLSIADLDRCFAVETAAFPPAEAATHEKIKYRLSVCPEICFGLFSSTNPGPPKLPQGDIPVLTKEEGNEGDVLVAHVISTRSNSKTVKDEDMSFPQEWQPNREAEYDVGHKPNGKTIALHSLAVAPSFQKSGFGKSLMKSYLGEIQKTGSVDRISILTYDRLISFYEKLGFIHYGKSESQYAGVAWHDLAYLF